VGITRRYVLSILFKLFDLTFLVGSLVAASITRLRTVSAISVTEFLAMRTSVRNFVLFMTLVAIWHGLFAFLELYESKRLPRRYTEAIDVLQATSLATVALFLVGSIFVPSIINPLSLAIFWSLSTFCRPKALVIDRNRNPDPYWMPFDQNLRELGEALIHAQLGNVAKALSVPFLMRRRVRRIKNFFVGK